MKDIFENIEFLSNDFFAKAETFIESQKEKQIKNNNKSSLFQVECKIYSKIKNNFKI